MTWIQFNEPTVKVYLEKNGTVYTVRHYPAKAPFIRGVRQGSNFLGFKVKLETVIDHLEREPHIHLRLAPYTGESGFESPHEWVDAIQRQHSGHKELWLLKATKMTG